MKDKSKSDKSLESFAIFPYVAWGLTIIFAVFVYNIAVDLQDTASRLQRQTEILESQVNTPVGEIKDFNQL